MDIDNDDHFLEAKDSTFEASPIMSQEYIPSLIGIVGKILVGRATPSTEVVQPMSHTQPSAHFVSLAVEEGCETTPNFIVRSRTPSITFNPIEAPTLAQMGFVAARSDSVRPQTGGTSVEKSVSIEAPHVAGNESTPPLQGIVVI